MRDEGWGMRGWSGYCIQIAKGMTSNCNGGDGDFGITMEHGFKGWDTDFSFLELTDFCRFCASRTFG